MKLPELPERAIDFQRMMRHIKKRSVLTLLFIGYFFSYSVSPLSYDISEKQGIDQLTRSAEGAPSSARSMRIFLWELIGSKLSVEKHVPITRPTVKILLRKVRAVMPQSIIEGSALAAKTAIADEADHFLFSVCAAVPKESRTALSQTGFSHLSRGRPPPSAA
jgi:hypothetical protein